MSADARAGDYFDTPERLERQQLLLHLVRNSGDVVYLRGPDGAGKTLFARRMFEQIGESLYGAWIVAGKEPDFVAAVNRQLSIANDRASPWPDSLMFALGEREMLLVVDDADAIDAPTLSKIGALQQRGGHVLLIGRGGLPPGATVSPQFMDLPGFDAEQSAAFLRSRSNAAAAAITDEVAGALHRAAQGMPGPLVEAMQVLGADRPVAGRGRTRPRFRGGPRLAWYLLAGVGVLLLGTVLWFQDSINDAVAPEMPTGAGGPIAASEPETGTAGQERQPPWLATRGESDRAASPVIVTPAVEPPMVAEAPAAPATPVDGAASEDIDPLEAVMLDALAAAREADPAPAGTGPTDTSPEAVAKPTAGPASPRPLSKPVDTSTMVAEVAAQGPEEGTPRSVAVTQAGAVPSTAEIAVPGVVDTAVAGDDIERTTPAPVEDRSISARAAAAPEPPATQPAPPPQPAPVVDRNPPKPAQKPAQKPAPTRVVAEGWLESRNPSHYTLQLVGARDRAAIDKFVRRYGIQQPYAVFERNLKGAPWYSLVAGEYPDRAAAVTARAALPAGLERSGVWPRTFESIYKLLQ